MELLDLPLELLEDLSDFLLELDCFGVLELDDLTALELNCFAEELDATSEELDSALELDATSEELEINVLSTFHLA